MQPTSVSDLSKLEEKYASLGLLKTRDGTGSRRYSVEKQNSVVRSSVSRASTITPGRRLSTENSRIFSNKQCFRDIVLKAAEHKPFLDRRDSRSRNRLAAFGHQARLEKFRRIASRWQSKAKNGPRSVDTLPEIDYEVEMPEQPRFCATLSTEAQYAIFKGYEDVLVDKIASSLPSTEKPIPIKRIPSATAKPKTKSNQSSLPVLENKPKIVLVSSANTAEREKNAARSARQQKTRDQRYMSTHFKEAMNILDELKRYKNSSSGTDQTSDKDKGDAITVQNNIRQYYAWSERWAKHFEFSC